MIIYILFFVLVQYMHHVCNYRDLSFVGVFWLLFPHFMVISFMVSLCPSWNLTTYGLQQFCLCCPITVGDVAENQDIGFHMCEDETEWRCCGRWLLLCGLL
jgi:hypothetical protein